MSLSGLRSDNIYDSSLTVVLAGLLVGKPAHVANTLLDRFGDWLSPALPLGPRGPAVEKLGYR